MIITLIKRRKKHELLNNLLFFHLKKLERRSSWDAWWHGWMRWAERNGRRT